MTLDLSCYWEGAREYRKDDEWTHIVYLLQVPTTQLANMSIDPKFVELTADVLEIVL